MRPGTVLVVDDEPAVRAYVATVLASQGYRTLQASGAKEALQLAAQNEVDLVVTDVVMPGMSGTDLVRELQRRGSKANYLLISGYAEKGDDKEQIPLLAKPFRMQDLVEAIGALTAKPAVQQENAGRDFPDALEDKDLLARLRAAEKGYRAAARDHDEAIREAQLRGWKNDADGSYSLQVHARHEREARAAFNQQVKELHDRVLHVDEPSPLTPRELEVLKLIAAGLSTNEIATRLGIAFKTAASHRSHIMEKLGLHNAASLVRYAMLHHLA